MNRTLYTHGGDFHVDELVAIALLHTFAFPGEALTVVRTRDKALIAQVREQTDTFLVDVGLEHAPERLNFDHHQTSLTQGWDDGTPMSSCGLVWSWLRARGYLADMPDDQLALIERDLIKPIDAHDNGVSRWPMAPVFRMYNRPGLTPAQVDEQFARALGTAMDLVGNQCNQARLDAQAEAVLREAWGYAEPRDEGIVIVHKQLGNRSAHTILAQVSDYQAKLMLYPQSANRKNNRWYIRALADGAGSTQHHAMLPTDWRGQNDATLDLGGGDTAQVVFTHKTGFLGLVEGQLDDAYRLAKAILAHPENRPVATTETREADRARARTTRPR